MRTTALLLALIAVVAIVFGTGAIHCKYQDTVAANDNTFTAFVSGHWNQTTRADFEAGVRSQVDTATSPGNVILAKQGSSYASPGTLSSQVYNTGVAGATIDMVSWDAITSQYTSIAFYVRASNAAFAAGNQTIAWVSIGQTSPVFTGLPRGQYVQWRAVLSNSGSTQGKKQTPTLQAVEVLFH